MHNQQGFTLLELLYTLAIVFILTSIAIPNFTALIESSRSRHLYNNIFTLIQYMRSKSVFLHSDVIMCPSSDEVNCVNNWQLPLIIFIDINKNKIRDQNEPIDRKIDLLKNGETFIWKASGTSRYLRFHSNGLTSSQNGTFTICPKKENLNNVHKIILFYSGRARKGLEHERTKNSCKYS